LSVGLPGTKQQANVLKFSLPVNFVVLIRVGTRSGHLGTDQGKWYGSESETPDISSTTIVGNRQLLYSL
jgi:hypothetical protein